MLDVSGVIFAGGVGKRLLPITNEIPKPLLELREGYTILDKQISDFKYAGIGKIYLLIGYLGQRIKERYGSNFEGVDIEYFEEEKPMGTLWALNNAFQNFQGDAVVRNGDVVSDINIKNFIETARKSKDLITLAVTKMRSPYGIVEFTDRRVIGFKEKPILNHYINAGIYYIKEEAFPYFSKEYDKKEIEYTVFPELVDERKVGVYYEDAFWRSVDGIKDLEAVQAEYEYKRDKPWGYEKTIVNNERYLVKELYIKKGYRTSLHYHPKKDESMHILEGEGYVEFEKGKVSLAPGEVVRIKPNRVHSIVAKENLKIFEYSTPHPKDSVRVKDYYGRI